MRIGSTSSKVRISVKTPEQPRIVNSNGYGIQFVIWLPHLYNTQPHLTQVAPPQNVSRRDLGLSNLGIGAWQEGQFDYSMG